jgi:hypothetical protein
MTDPVFWKASEKTALSCSDIAADLKNSVLMLSGMLNLTLLIA